MSRTKLKKFSAVVVVNIRAKNEAEARQIAANAAIRSTTEPDVSSAHVDSLEEVDGQSF